MPYAEACAHARAGLDIFGQDVSLFEATYFIRLCCINSQSQFLTG